ncbi:hypothetical protein I4U23_012150 [Adineta vaga]|nr:hypothetical protein I4U23_012150 [Adineta vaga]
MTLQEEKDRDFSDTSVHVVTHPHVDTQDDQPRTESSTNETWFARVIRLFTNNRSHSAESSSSIDNADDDNLINGKCSSCNLMEKDEKYDWELASPRALQRARSFTEELQPWYKSDKEFQKRVYTIIKGYLTIGLERLKNEIIADKIRKLFKQAMEKSDPEYIIKAYTSDASFTELLNRDMARNVLHDINQGCSKFVCDTLYTTEDGVKAIAGIFYHHSKVKTYSGVVYRGMLRDCELEHLQVNKCIITLTFLSTSIDCKITDSFSGYDSDHKKLAWPEDSKRISILLKFTIKNRYGTRRAFDISDMSQMDDEKEILLLPYSVFQITKRETIELEIGKRIEIELEDYDEVN